MPVYRKRTIDTDPLAGPVRDLKDAEKLAKEIDSGSLEALSKPEPDNLVVVLFESAIEPHSGSRQRLSWDLIRRLSIPELLSVGYDRGYWKKGVAKLSNEELRAYFSNAQDADTTLDA